MTAAARATIATLFALLALAGSAEAGKPEARSDLSSRLYEVAADPSLAHLPAGRLNEGLGLPKRGAGSLMREGNRLVVEIVTAADARKRAAGVVASGAEVLGVSEPDGTVTASVRAADLHALAGAPGVLAVDAVLTPMTNGAGDGVATSTINPCATGTVVTEADAQMKAAPARTQFDVDGTGVKVGVLSDSYDRQPGDSTSAAQDVATGDLPGPGNPCGRTTPVQILDDPLSLADDPIDEGRGMAQLVHDLAPGAQLAFATAFTGEAQFADNIRALATAGAKVIVDDVTYFTEPMFQDGPVAVAVNDVTAQGVTYFSSAANSNQIIGGNDVASLEAPAFRETGCPATGFGYVNQCMDFNPAAGSDSTYGISVPPGGDVVIALGWAQPMNGVTTDLDAYLLGTGLPVANTPRSEDVNTGVGNRPAEVLGYTNQSGATQNLGLVINRYTGNGGGNSGTPRLKLIALDGTPSEYLTSSGGDIVGPTIFGHNGAASAMSTAAVPFDSANTIEPFSSRGPVTTQFNPVVGNTVATANTQVLAKPDIAATDGGLTTFFGQPAVGGFRFFGTSAAAPDAAAVAALQLDANPSQSVAQVMNAQKSTANPVGAFSATAQGAGLVDALGAVPVNPPAPPVVDVSGPLLTNDDTPAFTITTSGNPKTSTCLIDGVATACASSLTTAPLTQGAHTVSAEFADYFGGSGADAISFTVDSTAPNLKIAKGPKKKSSKKKAKFRFEVDAGSALSCQLDKKPAAPCGTTAKFKVKPGKHKLTVTATDSAGNSAGAVYKWRRV